VLLSNKKHPIKSDSNTIVQFLIINKMKKIYLILLTVFLNMALFSCTPQAISETGKATTEQATTGDDGEILPPED
jgi:hypothetical protein